MSMHDKQENARDLSRSHFRRLRGNTKSIRSTLEDQFRSGFRCTCAKQMQWSDRASRMVQFVVRVETSSADGLRCWNVAVVLNPKGARGPDQKSGSCGWVLPQRSSPVSDRDKGKLSRDSPDNPTCENWHWPHLKCTRAEVATPFV